MQRTRALRRLTPTILVLNHQGEFGNRRVIARVAFGQTPFPRTVNSPQRKIARAILPAVNYTNTERAVYFACLNSAKARDASGYFLYHKQLGR